MDILETKTAKQKGESPKEYQIRICKNRKEYGMTWDDVAVVLNEEFDCKKSESVYRKWWYAFSDGCEYTNNMYSEIPQGTTYKDIQELQSVDSGEPQKIELETKNNGKQISTIKVKLTDEQKKDPDYLMKVHGYDPNKWELINSKQSIWNQNSKAKGMVDLYSSKITVKPRVGINWNKDNLKTLLDSLPDKVEFDTYSESKIEIIENSSDLLLIPLADIHFGLLATLELSGENYNTTIAKKRVKYVISDIIRRVQGRRFSEIVFLIGNDGLNADTIAGTTTRGTPQDQQMNWFETVRQFTELMTWCINELMQYAPVRAYFCPGNHDLQSTFMICEILKAYYRLTDLVQVCSEGTQRKYFSYGENMIGFSHDEKENNVAKIMAAEQPEMWGNTKYKYFLLSHLHHECVKDDYGVDIRRLPTISGRSYWTNKSGYVGTKKQAQAFIFNKEKGLTDVMNIIID